MSKSEVQKKLNQRSLYGANSMVFVLMPIVQTQENNDEFNEYINKNRDNFFQILSLFNENLNLDKENRVQALNLYEFLFVSYLDDNEQTKMVIEQIFGTTELTNYCYCLLEGDSVKDNGILQRTYQFFLQKICLKYASLHFASKSMSLRYEHVNNVATLADLFELTCIKFLDFLANHPLKNSIYLTLEDLIREYNFRAEKLVKLLANENYKYLTWPMPEMIDCESNLNESSSGNDEKLKERNTYWTLKYWNTQECFDALLNRQFFSLIRLEEFASDFESNSDVDLIDFGQIEECIFSYLSRVLKIKRSSNTLEAQNEVNSVFRLESAIKSILKSMKKSFILANTSFSTNQTNLPFKMEQSGELLVKKSSIEWSKLLIPIVEYLISNGMFKFKNVDKIYSHQFYIYYNLNEIKGYDWINNCVQLQLTPPSANSSTSSLSNLISPIQSNYLVKTYPKKLETSEKITHKNHKRRLSEELTSITTHHHQRSDTDDESNENTHNSSSFTEQANLPNTSPFDKSKSVKIFKRQMGSPLDNLATSPAQHKPQALGEHENKLDQFLNLLRTEKENNFKFENRLTKLQSSNTNERLVENDEGIKEISASSNEDGKNLDMFLEKIKQEKLKNEEFNLKLNQNLNYAKF